MKDWQSLANNPTPSSSPAPGAPSPSGKPQGSPLPQEQQPAEIAGNGEQESEEGKGQQREPQQAESRSGSKAEQLARAEALRMAGDLEALLTGKTNERSGAGDHDAQPKGPTEYADEGGIEILQTGQPASDWNRLNSKLSKSVLQEKVSKLPEEYRGAIEAYFRQLSTWNNGTISE